jgi:hypothetical protein
MGASVKKLYIINRADLFDAIPLGQIPEGSLQQAGSLWCHVLFTDAERDAYWFPIRPYS